MSSTQSRRARSHGSRAARRAAAAAAQAQSAPGLARPEAHYRFVAPHRARTLAVCLMIGGIVAGVVAASTALSEDSTRATELLAASAVCVAVLWGVLMVWTPQVVTVDRSVIEIKRGGRAERFDLVDPNVDIRVVDGAIAFTHYDGRWVTVLAADVDWKVFTDVVMFYQNHADSKAEERTERWGR